MQFVDRARCLYNKTILDEYNAGDVKNHFDLKRATLTRTWTMPTATRPSSRWADTEMSGPPSSLHSASSEYLLLRMSPSDVPPKIKFNLGREHVRAHLVSCRS